MKTVIPSRPLHLSSVLLEAKNPKQAWLHQKPAAFYVDPTRGQASRTRHNTRPFVYVDDPFNPVSLPNRKEIIQQNKLDFKCLWRTHLSLPKVTQGRKFPLSGKPFAKGVVLKTIIKKPKKPNSANRRCVRVRLPGGKEYVAHVPGEGHNLQEHSIVLVRNGRTQDLIGVKLKVVRGKYDCAKVKKRTE
jgi:small subunit ribosomal protein S12